MQRGYTIIEIVIVVLILAILATIISVSLSSFRTQQVLKTTTDSVIALLNDARTRTLSSENSLQYGVRLTASQAQLFSGTSYSSSAVVRTFTYDTGASLGSISLHGSGSDVVFERLTGDTDEYGTMIVSVSGLSTQKTITVSQTGIVSSN